MTDDRITQVIVFLLLIAGTMLLGAWIGHRNELAERRARERENRSRR